MGHASVECLRVERSTIRTILQPALLERLVAFLLQFLRGVELAQDIATRGKPRCRRRRSFRRHFADECRWYVLVQADL